jgi:hypothetical protein
MTIKLTVKNYKHCEWASEETDCFTASLYLDGKRIGTAENSGHGGCDFYHFTTPANKAAFEAYAEEWANSDEVQNDPAHQINGKCYAGAESLVAEACKNFRREKMAKRALKNKGKADFSTVILIERTMGWQTEVSTISIYPHHDLDAIIAEKAQDGDAIYTYTADDGLRKTTGTTPKAVA